MGFDSNYDGVEDVRVELSVLSDAKQCVEHILLLKPKQRIDHQELAWITMRQWRNKWSGPPNGVKNVNVDGGFIKEMAQGS